MSSASRYPVDISLWARAKTAPKTELWRWGWDLWNPIIDKIYSGEESVRDLGCPVCGQKELYAYFLAVAFSIPCSKAEGRRVYMADRWFGCHNCLTQVRDRGQIPRWVKDDDVVWGSERLRRLAEEDLTRSGFATQSKEDQAK